MKNFLNYREMYIMYNVHMKLGQILIISAVLVTYPYFWAILITIIEGETKNNNFLTVTCRVGFGWVGQHQHGSGFF